MVAADLLRRGHKIAIPYGEDWDYDLILCRGGALERVQVKHSASRDAVRPVNCRSHSLTNGRVRAVKRYTSASIDWLAVYDATTGGCYYIPAAELGEGRAIMHLRVGPARNGQQRGVRWATDYLQL